MANILKELFRREKISTDTGEVEKNIKYEIAVDAKNVILNSDEKDSREAYTNLADKLKIFNKMNNIRLTTTEDLKKIGNASGELAHAEGVGTIASGVGSHAEGHNTEASNQDSHAEGYTSIASGYASHAEGTYFGTLDTDDMQRTVASGAGSHAEGVGSQAKGGGSHSEGVKTVAEGEASHAEGSSTQALAKYSHAEGVLTTVNESATGGHAEGYKNEATGYASHAEGCETFANGNYSHTEGSGTIAQWHNQHVQGRYNEELLESEAKKYAHIVGGGSYNNGSPIRKNIHTLDWNGNAHFAGNISAGKEDENSEIKGNLIVDGKITAKMGLVNESGSEDFKTENLQVDNKIILGEGHSIESIKKESWIAEEEDRFSKRFYRDNYSIQQVYIFPQDFPVNLENGLKKDDYNYFYIKNAYNIPFFSASRINTYYRGVFTITKSSISDSYSECLFKTTDEGCHFWVPSSFDIVNFILYSQQNDDLFIGFYEKYYFSTETELANQKGFLITGQYGKKIANDNYAHIIGGGSSEEDRKNIYTLDWDGNVEFAGNITFTDNNKNQISIQDLLNRIVALEKQLKS